MARPKNEDKIFSVRVEMLNPDRTNETISQLIGETVAKPTDLVDATLELASSSYPDVFAIRSELEELKIDRVQVSTVRRPSRTALNLWNHMIWIASKHRFEDREYQIALNTVRDWQDTNDPIVAAAVELRTMVVRQRVQRQNKPKILLDNLFKGVTEIDVLGTPQRFIHFRFSDTVRQLFLDYSSGFARIHLPTSAALTTVYALKLYELGCLLAYRDHKTLTVEKEWLFDYLQVPNKHPARKNFAVFRRTILDPALAYPTEDKPNVINGQINEIAHFLMGYEGVTGQVESGTAITRIKFTVSVHAENHHLVAAAISAMRKRQAPVQHHISATQARARGGRRAPAQEKEALRGRNAPTIDEVMSQELIDKFAVDLGH